MAKVFIINQPRATPRPSFGLNYDVSPAAEHGEVVFIFTETKFPSPSANLEEAIAHAWKVLEDFDSKVDFIVWAGGDPISMLIVAPILFDLAEDGTVNYLKFERGRGRGGEKLQAGSYSPQKVNVFED